MPSSFDPAKDAANLRKHGISLTEGDGVLNDPLAFTIEDTSAEGEQRFISIGMNVFGQFRVVVYALDGEEAQSSRCVRRNRRKSGTMKKENDFSKGKRGAVLPAEGKTRITIYLDDVVIDRFKSMSEKTGKGYQTLVNEALRAHLGVEEPILTASSLRRILREELHGRGLTTRSTGPAGTGLLSRERRRRRAG